MNIQCKLRLAINNVAVLILTMGGGWSDKTIPGGWMNKTISMLSSTPVEVDVELGNIEGLDPIPRLAKSGHFEIIMSDY